VAALAPSSASLLRPALWLVIGGWLGVLVLFGLVARVAFTVGASPELAGHVVAGVLGPLELGGVGAGIALAALGGGLRRGRWAVLLPILLSLVCFTSHFGVSPALAEIRLGSPGAPPGEALRFARLHRLSVGLYGLTLLGVLGLAVLHARAEGSAARVPGRRRDA
jgi:hypothetical protein